MPTLHSLIRSKFLGSFRLIASRSPNSSVRFRAQCLRMWPHLNTGSWKMQLVKNRSLWWSWSTDQFLIKGRTCEMKAEMERGSYKPRDVKDLQWTLRSWVTKGTDLHLQTSEGLTLLTPWFWMASLKKCDTIISLVQHTCSLWCFVTKALAK
jgi:hypothetical protein